MEDTSCPHCGVALAIQTDGFCGACREPIDASTIISRPVDASTIVIRPGTIAERVLLAYLAWRTSPTTAMSLLRRSFWTFAFSVASMGGAACFAYFALEMELLAIGAVGLLLGTLLRDIAWLSAVERSWPTTAAILDWKRIQQLVSKEPPALHEPAPPKDDDISHSGIQNLDRR